MTRINSEWTDPKTTRLDFIIVGAGAGGAPLAARLVERGFQVLVVEMGPKKPNPLPGTVVDCTDVPLLHSETTEDKRHSLRYFVDHFSGENEDRNPRRHQNDPEEHKAINPHDEEGVFYPRGQGIGGCTIHNAMVTICGPSEDWDEIAEQMRDPSWRGERMRAYFERIERCNYDRSPLWARLFGWLTNAMQWKNGRHGHDGWLQTSLADLRLLYNEKKFLKIVAAAAFATLDTGIESLARLKSRQLAELDPNHWETMRRSQEGLAQIPSAITLHGERSSPRERLLLAQVENPDKLHTLTGTFVTEILFKGRKGGEPIEACGVQVLEQEHVYQADAQPVKPVAGWKDKLESLYCKREVILCGGSFNTPQLLMLSGIGPANHLKDNEIVVIQDMAAVGQYMQDRYEVPIIATVSDRFRSLDSLSLTSTVDDPVLRQWRENRGQSQGANVYATNGGLIGVFKRSRQETKVPDLFMFALAGNFEGYKVGWSKPATLAPDDNDPNQNGAADHKRKLTWLILKARSRNKTGTVRLRDSDPFRRPKIDFNIFPENKDKNKDVQAIYEGVQFVTEMLDKGKKDGLIESYELPHVDARAMAEDVDDALRKRLVEKWIKDVAWGHHACGTCRIGDDAKDSVIDQRFRVHGVKGLRIVDASIFAKIPGYFIVTNVYMISEKAADVISEDHSDHFAKITDNQTVQDNLQRSPIFQSNVESRERNDFPVEMEDCEAKLIKERRKVAGCG